MTKDEKFKISDPRNFYSSRERRSPVCRAGMKNNNMKAFFNFWTKEQLTRSEEH